MRRRASDLLREWLDGSLTSVSPATELQFTNYIGAGGLGEVWAVRESGNQLRRKLAAKVLLRAGDDQLRKRFRYEGELLGSVVSPYVVRIHYVLDLLFEELPESLQQRIRHEGVWAERVPGLVMERLGESLRRGPGQNPFPKPDAMRYVSDVLGGVADLHAEGVHHGDIKPANLLRDDRDRVKIADFGRASHLPQDAGITLTAFAATDAMVATAAYAAPEEIEAERAGEQEIRSPAIDLYQAAATAFQLLTGVQPYPEPTIEEVRERQRALVRPRDRQVAVDLLLERVLNSPVPDPREYATDIPDAVAAWVMRGLAKAPEERWPTARDALEAWHAAVDEVEAARAVVLLEETVRHQGEARAVAERSLAEARSRADAALSELAKRDARIEALELRLAEALEATGRGTAARRTLEQELAEALSRAESAACEQAKRDARIETLERQLAHTAQAAAAEAAQRDAAAREAAETLADAEKQAATVTAEREVMLKELAELRPATSAARADAPATAVELPKPPVSRPKRGNGRPRSGAPSDMALELAEQIAQTLSPNGDGEATLHLAAGEPPLAHVRRADNGALSVVAGAGIEKHHGFQVGSWRDFTRGLAELVDELAPGRGRVPHVEFVTAQAPLRRREAERAGPESSEPQPVTVDDAAYALAEDLIAEVTRGRGRREVTLHDDETAAPKIRVARERGGQLRIVSESLRPSQRVLLPRSWKVLGDLVAEAITRTWSEPTRAPLVRIDGTAAGRWTA